MRVVFKALKVKITHWWNLYYLAYEKAHKNAYFEECTRPGGTTRKLRQARYPFSILSRWLSKSPLLYAFHPYDVIMAFECALQVSILR